MVLFIFSIGLIIQGYIFLFPGFFLQELAISFLPYIVVINCIILILHLVLFFIKPQKIIIVLSFLVYAMIAFVGYHNIQEAYLQQNSPMNTQGTEHTESLSIFYANIYYQNSQTAILLDQIQQEDRDVVMLIEYSKYHDELLTPLLREKYPYVSRYVGSKGYDGDIVFSKHPFQKIAQDNTPGSFSHLSINYKNKVIDIILMHTSAPVSRKFLTMRNKQLTDLISIVRNHYDSNPVNNLLIVGDFNITPRSHYYQFFQPSLHKMGLYNITSDIQATSYDRPLPYTWCMQQLPILCAHIDHLWSTNPMELKLVKIIGSDHYGFVGLLLLE